VLAARVETALKRGDAALALQLVEELIAAADNLDDPTRAIPRLWHLRGQALMALQRTDEAELMLSAALQVSDVQGAFPQRWRILVSLGYLYLSVGKRSEVEGVLTEARLGVEQLAKALNDEPLAEALRHRAEALMPVRPTPTQRQAVKAAFDGLTDREREIASLIAEGKSNREIAEALYLSKRTVDAHIGNILGKLGFASRTQIARWAVEKGLLESS
jgi:DNA-binding CsgD family transcriptional regulator